ncbi:glycosyltransferase family 4 protein [Gammaproteobacteria bacterium]|nr:glycosyltransferase family 4 protein [Gammaproteobacteria bacterium]
MKIIHLILSDVYAGMEQYVNELIIEQENECDVVLICTKNISKKFKNKNTVSIKDFSRNSPIGLLSMYFLIKKQNADLIHTHGSKTASIVNILKRFLNIKHVASAHGIKKKDKPFLKADKLICASVNVQKSIKRNSIVVNNWYSPILPKKIDRTPEYVIAVGRLEKVKGFDLLIKSWVRVQAKLMIIGSGNEFKKLNDLIYNLKLENKIKIIDAVTQEELIKYYQKASMMVISSRNEGGPRVALEALKLEIPVISTSVGNMPEILPQELLAIPDNLDSLRNLVEKYVNNLSYKQDSIFEYIQEEFSLEEKTQQIMDIYKELLIS